MNAVVVYESIWGNTAAVARAIAEGIGDGARVLTTDQATPDVMAAADLVVVGAPLHAFGLPSDRTRAGIARDERKQPTSADLWHPAIRTWLASLPATHGRFAAFETRMRWSPGGACGGIAKGLAAAGFSATAPAAKFVVQGTRGPLRPGELDRARAWGAALAHSMSTAAVIAA